MTRQYLCLSGLLLFCMVTRDPRVRRILGRQFEGIIEKQSFFIGDLQRESWNKVMPEDIMDWRSFFKANLNSNAMVDNTIEGYI